MVKYEDDHQEPMMSGAIFMALDALPPSPAGRWLAPGWPKPWFVRPAWTA